MKNRIFNITAGAVTAALYTVLTLISSMAGMSSGVIQVRLSEALTILPVFTPAAVPGLFAGCVISNLLTGCALFDIIFGSAATLLGAVFTYLLRKHRLLASIPPIAANTLIVPWILSIVYSFEGSIWFFTITVFAGEFISAGVLGQILRKALEPHENVFEGRI